MIKPIKDERYKFEMVIPMMRWVDFQRIRHIFPGVRGESMPHYFRRLALWLKEQEK
jgi:hypothetical protein